MPYIDVRVECDNKNFILDAKRLEHIIQNACDESLIKLGKSLVGFTVHPLPLEEKKEWCKCGYFNLDGYPDRCLTCGKKLPTYKSLKPDPEIMVPEKLWFGKKSVKRSLVLADLLGKQDEIIDTLNQIKERIK